MVAQVPMSELDIAKRRLVQAFEEGSDPDLDALVRALPEHREELLDFWVILSASDREADTDVKEIPTRSLSEKEEATIRDVCLSVSLGPEWLNKPVDEGDRTLTEVGLEMRRVRRSPDRYTGRANEHFRRAAIYAWLTYRWAGSTDSTASRMAVQKLAYLLDKGLGLGVFGKHKKHRLGPYDPTARYRDAEPIALKNRYLVSVGKYELGLGPDIEKALGMAKGYLRDAAVADAFVCSLMAVDVDEWVLETMATVHAIAVSMRPKDVSVDAVRSVLAKDETWSRKLRRRNFTRSKIKQALHRLALLGLIEADDQEDG